jgi:peptide/nickel transport system substrate-binding protein
VAWIVYDRLITHGRKTLPNGVVMYDYTKLDPNWPNAGNAPRTAVRHLPAAQERQVPRRHAGHGRRREMELRTRARHGRLPEFQMKAGSLEKPEQFEAVDEHTFG